MGGTGRNSRNKHFLLGLGSQGPAWTGLFQNLLEREWQVGRGIRLCSSGTQSCHPCPRWHHGLDTLVPPPLPRKPEPTTVAGTLPVLFLWAAGPGAPHCRLVLVSSPGSATPFRQKRKKKKMKKKKKTVLFLPSRFSQRVLVGVILPLWAHSLLPPQLTHRCAREAASCVGEVGGFHSPLPDTHWSMPCGGQGRKGLASVPG